MKKLNRDWVSIITDILLKIGLIFYIFSMLFRKETDEGMGYLDTPSNAENVIKFTIISLFSFMLFILTRKIFLMVFFSTTIIVPFFNALMFLSSTYDEFANYLELSDEFLIIVSSVFFMVRYFGEPKRKSANAKKVRLQFLKVKNNKSQGGTKRVRSNHISESYFPDKMNLDK